MMTDATKPPKTKAVPTLHQWMIWMISGITLFAMIMYGFVDASRADLFEKVVILGVGALLGKFTNGFGGGKDSIR